MTLSRRRFLIITAASAAAAMSWRGLALGAEAAITLRGGDPGAAERALAAARDTLARMERRFSLWNSGSNLSRLNRDGLLRGPAPEFLHLLALCDVVHAATGGLFDPTIQPLWQAYATAAPRAPDPVDLASARARVGWAGVAFDPDAVRLTRPGMALSLNGIAQGFATDRVTDTLADHGFAKMLVSIGEFRAGLGAWRIGIADPAAGLVATRSLTRAAIATSSPGALRFGPAGPCHILHPRDPAAPARWSTVSAQATEAARSRSSARRCRASPTSCSSIPRATSAAHDGAREVS